MKRLLVVIMVICCIALSSCTPIAYEEQTRVTGTVTRIQYNAGYVVTIPISDGENTTMVTQTYPDEYLVTIDYQGISRTFDNYTLYKSVKEGDEISVILCQAYDENDKLIRTYIKLP